MRKIPKNFFLKFTKNKINSLGLIFGVGYLALVLVVGSFLILNKTNTKPQIAEEKQHSQDMVSMSDMDIVTDSANPTAQSKLTLTTTPATKPNLANTIPFKPVAISGQLCPAWVHDSYTVTGPDGKVYPTWHPKVDKSGCYFDHEHGDDPRTSLANSSLPPFGYVASLGGMSEPHNGFKVFVVNKGMKNDEGRVATTNTRIVAHMGTSGTKRFNTQMHTLMFDLTSDDGHFVHLQGMADTGGTGSICDNPRQGKTVSLTPGSGCKLSSLYEIWLFTLKIGDKATAIVSTAVFDPITLLNPSNRSETNLTDNFFPGKHRGCDSEAYHGPVYWYNSGGSTVYYTDALGNIGKGHIKQEISANSDIGIKMYQDQTQMKYRRDNCSSNLGLAN